MISVVVEIHIFFRPELSCLSILLNFQNVGYTTARQIVFKCDDKLGVRVMLNSFVLI